MSDLCRLIWCGLIGLFRPRVALEAEILVLRHQLNVLRRKSPKRVAVGSIDRLLLVGLYRLAPGVLDALKIIRPETLLRWHRGGFRTYWRWKSRPLGGRPTTPADIRRLICEMSVANPLWGVPRIHGELLKLGIDVGQTTVAKYMARRRRPPSQGWKTFLRNHADGVASMDLVPTISFRLLYAYGQSIRRSDARLHPATEAFVTAEGRTRVGRANFGRPAPPIYPSVSFRQGHCNGRKIMSLGLILLIILVIFLLGGFSGRFGGYGYGFGHGGIGVIGIILIILVVLLVLGKI